VRLVLVVDLLSGSFGVCCFRNCCWMCSTCCGRCWLLKHRVQSLADAIARYCSFHRRVRPVSFASWAVRGLLRHVSPAILQCILLHASLTVARLVLCRRHWRRHVSVACTSRIEVALTCLAQRPATARQCWQSRGWLEPRRAHVFELRLRALHCDGTARRACNV
jgi:hypothetical protein